MSVAPVRQTFDRPPAHVPSVSRFKTLTVETTNGWPHALPVLKKSRVQLRELQLSDAPSLLRALSTDEVTRFISPPPKTIPGFERFIDWTSSRSARDYLCFAIVEAGTNDAIGIIQVRRLNGSFETAEWGFAIAQPFWGTGVFIEAAELVLGFCFKVLGVHRLEARAATANGRGNGALRKVGASCEAILKRSFLRDGRCLDQFLWSIVREDWEVAKAGSG